MSGNSTRADSAAGPVRVVRALTVAVAIALVWPAADSLSPVDRAFAGAPPLAAFWFPVLNAFAGAAADAPVYQAPVVPVALEQDFTRKSFKRDAQSGNFLGPKVSGKTLKEPLVPVFINGKYAKDMRGQTVFLRLTIRDKLVAADEAMFAKKHDHIKVNYGFRSNLLQYELFQQLNGKGKVAPPGMSFHETGMAVDVNNWRDAQRFMIEAGFVGGCYGIEEDFVHYSINEITKASNGTAFRRCTLKEIPEHILNGMKKVGNVVTAGHFKKK